ncbi:hypothetical protein ACHAWF_015388 [Thalassiosira exigua]
MDDECEREADSSAAASGSTEREEGDDGASSSSTDDDGDDDDYDYEEDDDEEEEEERWSLRVRLLSAVDLPPSLSPNVPLCPWFRLGLVEDVNAALDRVAESDRERRAREAERAAREAEEAEEEARERERRRSRALRPRREEGEGGGDDEEDDEGDDDGGDPSDAGRAPAKKKDRASGGASSSSSSATTTAEKLLASLDPPSVRSSSHRIMSRGANGGGGNGADWDEEHRWDDLGNPVEACLVVRLCARTVPDGGGGGGGGRFATGTIGGGGGALLPPGGSFSEDRGDAGGDDASDAGLATGIRGLWRQGRERLEEHARRRSTLAATGGGGAAAGAAGQREERAAAVAQFLMRGGQGDDGSAATGPGTAEGGTSSSTLAGGGSRGLDQRDLVEYQKKWSEGRPRRSDGKYGSAGDLRAVRSHRVDEEEEEEEEEDERDRDRADAGLCLGTLAVPLSRLPLVDAFRYGGAATAERWYQLEDPHAGSAGGKRGSDGGGGGSSGAEGDGGGGGGGGDEPTLLHGPRRCPSVLLEITFASADYLDEREDEARGWDGSDPTADAAGKPTAEEGKEDGAAAAPSTPAPREEEEEKAKEGKGEEKPPEPELRPGIIDFLCVVGARDIGNQRSDDGGRGWVQSTPECCVLERHPPADEFHVENGRNVGLIPQIEWFCFPEGCRLWRGTAAPTPEDLRKGGVSVSAPSSGGGGGGRGDGKGGGCGGGDFFSPAKFERALNTTASFSYFVLSSNSDVYGSRLVKTYGVLVRFYVPAPAGIDPTQDDFAQAPGSGPGGAQGRKERARLWVPVGIVVTTTLPIVGVVEEVLRRTCDALASKHAADDATASVTLSHDSSSSVGSAASRLHATLQSDLYHLIVNHPKPMDGAVHVSVPFGEGERLCVEVPPPDGLPPLPHGGAVSSACRLLGAEGLTLLLAAALTECRVLVHSVNVANVAMVAEVVTALLFPFTWQLPYIPVLPQGMLEVLEAPLPFFVGVPTRSLEMVDSTILAEVVVVDLDDVASFTEYDARRGPRTKIPPALPASVSSSISKAVHRLLKEEDELEAQTLRVHAIPGLRRPPRLEIESLPERKFRVHVAIQICSLVRGYQECLFFVSASQPVFNRDRFLRQAPALFEDKRPSVLVDSGFSDRSQKILSPRSKRFLSVLVNSQHFHQLLERLSSEETAFFHEVMEAIEGGGEEDDPESSTTGKKHSYATSYGSSACEAAGQKLFESLEVIEQRIPTYVFERPGSKRKRRSPPGPWRWEDEADDDEWKFEPYVRSDEPFWLLPECNARDKTPPVSFTNSLLRPIMADKSADSASSSGDAGVHALSLEYLVELEKNPWRYEMKALFGPTKDDGDTDVKQESDGQQRQVNEVTRGLVLPRVTLREALGERRFRAWKAANNQGDDGDEAHIATPVVEPDEDDAFDLSGLLANVPELPLAGEADAATSQPAQAQRDADDRERVRRCLEIAFGSSGGREGEAIYEEGGRDLIADAELALRSPSAQRYLFSVLVSSVTGGGGRATKQQAVSRLEPGAFECIVRLCYAVLEACMEEQNYESAYRLLTFTGGFCMSTAASGVGPVAQAEQKTVYMTERISIHPIFADLRLWERVLLLHQQGQQNNDRKDESNHASEKEEDDGEGAATPDDIISEDEEVTADTYAHDSVVNTIYEMVGYNVAAEEVSRFASRISEEKGWFATEKGQSLLVLVRRLTSKRDEGSEHVTTDSGGESGFGFLRKDSIAAKGGVIGDDAMLESEEIAWSHPSTCLVSHGRQGVGARAFLGNMLGGSVNAEIPMVGTSSSHGNSTHGVHRGISKREVLDATDHAGRVAITAMASFGGSAVVTGGIDGSVFLAYNINFGGADEGGHESTCSSRNSTCLSPLHSNLRSVNGAQLHWGGTGDAIKDTGSSGSVTCVTASKGSGYRLGGSSDEASTKPGGGDGCPDEEEIISSMDGCWIIAGTTGGNLRVWSLQDVFAASCMISRREGGTSVMSSPNLNRSHHGSGATSVLLGGADDFGLQEAVTGAPVGGHRGGVTCIDLPPRMYRPDSLVSGGEDGLIKMWSLKSSSSGSDQDGGVSKNSLQSRLFHNRQIASISTTTDFDASDGAQGVLAGHEGKIICIRTAWHGDKLLSGGADKTVRLWDLSGSASSSSKPLTTLRGHQGWVTHTHFWGPNTIVSASTDRSIHLWDTRIAGSCPLFALRYHLSPVSDLLLGSRSDPLMVSAGSDGGLATWDFRMLASARNLESTSAPDADKTAEGTKMLSRTIRSPVAKMNHLRPSSTKDCGSIKLTKSVGRDDFSFFSIGDDGVVNEWDALKGSEIGTHVSGHRDAISDFASFTAAESLGSQREKVGSKGGPSIVGGTITCSWDGTVRLRRLSRKPAR